MVLNGCVSDWSDVHSGVPQGSVLGPVLFIIYVNDMHNDILSKLLKFADDAKLYGTVSCSEDFSRLQSDLDRLSEWSGEWQMLFNVEKCKVMHIGKNNIKGEYTIADSILKVVHNEKDLGVIVQEDLKVSEHCSEIVKTCNRILGMISSTFTSRSKIIILKLYKSHVRPH